LTFFHAERNETQLTTGMFGKPQQGYGFSNNATDDGGNLALQGSLTY
jgi:uncharacterized protein (DUF2141 family)